MNRLEDKFWDWATASFVRLGTMLVVIHALLTAPFRKRRRNHG